MSNRFNFKNLPINHDFRASFSPFLWSLFDYYCYRRYYTGFDKLAPLGAELERNKQRVTNESYIPICQQWSRTERVDKGIYFFGNMTTYIGLLAALRKNMVEEIVAELQSVSSCNNMQCSAMQCNAVQCSAMQCNAVQCSAMQCNAMQYNAMSSAYVL